MMGLAPTFGGWRLRSHIRKHCCHFLVADMCTQPRFCVSDAPHREPGCDEWHRAIPEATDPISSLQCHNTRNGAIMGHIELYEGQGYREDIVALPLARSAGWLLITADSDGDVVLWHVEPVSEATSENDAINITCLRRYAIALRMVRLHVESKSTPHMLFCFALGCLILMR